MTERQAAYSAGPAHPTSVERLCDALELDYAPAVYSTPALFDKAADKITALQYALEAANAERDALQEKCNVYTEQMQTYGRINEYCAKLEGDLYTASWQRDKLAEKLDEAKRIAELRLKDCETMAEEAEKYKDERDTLLETCRTNAENAEKQAKLAVELQEKCSELQSKCDEHLAKRKELHEFARECTKQIDLLLSQRDEARAWALKLWREKRKAEEDCKACNEFFGEV